MHWLIFCERLCISLRNWQLLLYNSNIFQRLRYVLSLAQNWRWYQQISEFVWDLVRESYLVLKKKNWSALVAWISYSTGTENNFNISHIPLLSVYDGRYSRIGLHLTMPNWQVGMPSNGKKIIVLGWSHNKRHSCFSKTAPPRQRQAS